MLGCCLRVPPSWSRPLHTAAARVRQRRMCLARRVSATRTTAWWPIARTWVTYGGMSGVAAATSSS